MQQEIPVTGILITNLGTPDAPTASALRCYLGEFLWDKRVVEIARPIWWVILHGIILRTRPAKSAKAYVSVWMEGGSPLLVYSKGQKEALQVRLKERFNGPVVVELGMRYGNPSIESGLEKLREAGAQRILVLPLYPQYSAATTASTFDAVANTLKKWRWIPELRFVQHYHDAPSYIQALANSIEENWKENGRAEKLVFSFHGMPKRTLLAGDPYHCECQKTARLVAEKINLGKDQYLVSFQSLFGKEEWLKPYTDASLKKLAADGVKSLDIICPGFSADCVETLEEIMIENKDYFLEGGGERFNYIPALNVRDDHIAALEDIVANHTQGWAETNANWNQAEAEQALADSQRCGREMGAV
ncbi:MAG: ferrochelatase [Gammaproteobacteria bacterium]|nr:ferrochelatase [bacterium AH-315-E07]PCH61068.1 MAG: ferrochelatase [Gammaproteobacteria bacterium]